MKDATLSSGAVRRSITLLILAQVAVLSVWFSATAILPLLANQYGLATSDLAGLATATQAGFVLGAFIFALTGLPDRIDPRRLFAICSIGAALANMALFITPPHTLIALLSRLMVGALLAGVYPVGLKIAMGWSARRRGLLASLLVGALTLGSAMPQLITFLGGADWRIVLLATSASAILGATLILTIGLGPYHVKTGHFSPRSLLLVTKDRKLRRAYLGYFGHMWELYAYWAWAPAALLASGLLGSDPVIAGQYAAGWIFFAMVLGAVACVPFGLCADKLGKARVAKWLLWGSGISAAIAAVSFNSANAVFLLAILSWGLFIIPDSPLFSAMVADAAPAENTGSLLTLQTALGFALTILSVQLTPLIAENLSWSWAIAILILGPACGLSALKSPKDSI